MSDLAPAVLNRLNLRDQLLDAYPELANDEAALLDTLAGMDGFEEQCAAALREALAREAMRDGLIELVRQMQARAERLNIGAEKLRAAVLQAMQSAGVPKLKAPDMSVSIGTPKRAVIITDAGLLPSTFVRIKHEPDKRAIAAALEAGKIVPGATLGNSTPFLQLHRR